MVTRNTVMFFGKILSGGNQLPMFNAAVYREENTLLDSTLDIIVTISGFTAAILALVSLKKQREIEKNGIYQQLELASIGFFKWEAENNNTLSKIRNNQQNISDDEEKIAETYYTQVMNLFELIIHNINRRAIPHEVFGSWLPWIHEFANEPGFDKIWPEIRLHYIPECRKVIESAMEQPSDKFIWEICKNKKYKLKIGDWMGSTPEEKAQFNISNVEIKQGEIKHIQKYISIFDECKHDGYISHGEVLCGRATNDLKWADNINAQMNLEFTCGIISGKYNVFEITSSEEIIGFAIIELHKKTKAAVLSDIMIRKNFQGKGVGKEALRKIEEFLKKINIGILILESGVKNTQAHEFFEKNGYTKISVEYSKGLG